MKIYIRSAASISPQKTFGDVPLLNEPIEYKTNRLHAVEPDYSNFIDTKMLRRMSRIIKMGVTAALKCLQDANLKNPDAIITGTAYGCMADSEIFLSKIIEQNEEMLSPTSFIQSTHNTIAAQVALLLNCHQYNNTFVHKGFSFEAAMLDAFMLLHDNEAENVLTGSTDEITDISHTVLSRIKLYKRLPVSNFDLFSSNTSGTIAGEGAAFFLLSNQPSSYNYAAIDGIKTFYKPNNTGEIAQQILSFLKLHSTNIPDIDLVITGKNGDIKNDSIYDVLQQSVFKNTITINYKNLCGEYPTSVSFAVWLAVNIFKAGIIPSFLQPEKFKGDKLKNILIYNYYQHSYHSLFLMSAI